MTSANNFTTLEGTYQGSITMGGEYGENNIFIRPGATVTLEGTLAHNNLAGNTSAGNVSIGSGSIFTLGNAQWPSNISTGNVSIGGPGPIFTLGTVVAGGGTLAYGNTDVPVPDQVIYDGLINSISVTENPYNSEDDITDEKERELFNEAKELIATNYKNNIKNEYNKIIEQIEQYDFREKFVDALKTGRAGFTAFNSPWFGVLDSESRLQIIKLLDKKCEEAHMVTITHMNIESGRICIEIRLKYFKKSVLEFSNGTIMVANPASCIDNKVEKLIEKVDKLSERTDDLETEVSYRPGGKAYEETLKCFETLSTKQSILLTKNDEQLVHGQLDCLETPLDVCFHY